MNFDDRILENVPSARSLIEGSNSYGNYKDMCLRVEQIPMSQEDFVMIIANIMAAGRSLQEKAEFYFEALKIPESSKFKIDWPSRGLLCIPYPLHTAINHMIYLMLEFEGSRVTITCFLDIKKS